MRRGYVRLGRVLAIAVLAMAGPAEGAEVPAAPRPNVVLIVADDHGVDALGAYGSTDARTPNLDRLAREGVRFTRAFASAASCSTSRSALLSGLHAHANGMYGHHHVPHHMRSFDTVRALGPRLSAAGYRTARIGKFHVGPDSVYAFDEVLAPESAFDWGRSIVEMAEAVRPFVRAAGKPFFLYFAPTDPHRSGDPGADVNAFGRRASEPNRFGRSPQGHPGVRDERVDPAQVATPRFLADTPVVRAEWAAYLAAVSRLDQGIGRLLEVLAAEGKLDETVVIYLSDNGPPFAGAKTNVYEPGIRLPLIVRAPGVADPGGVRHAMVSWVDVAPTVLDFAGAPPAAAEFHGRSFRAVLEHGDAPGWDRVNDTHTFHEIQMYYPMRAVRTERYKLIWNLASPLAYPWASDLYFASTGGEAFARRRVGPRRLRDYQQRAPFELYDLERDPLELRNLADSPSHAATLKTLKDELRRFQERTADPWASKWLYE